MFHRVPDFAWNEWNTVERVLTIPEDRFRGSFLFLLDLLTGHEPPTKPLSLPSPRDAGRGWPKAGRGEVHGKESLRGDGHPVRTISMHSPTSRARAQARVSAARPSEAAKRNSGGTGTRSAIRIPPT